MLHPKVKLIRDELHNCRIKNVEYAKEMGVNPSTISRIFSGKQEVTLGFYDEMIKVKIRMIIQKRGRQS